MERNLLIHSMAEFAPITLLMLQAVDAKIICEIGAEDGGNSKLLYDWLKPRNGTLLSIDPKPNQSFIEWLTKVGDVVKHIPKPSHTALAEIKKADAWFIDGDHNWYTVYHELDMIRKQNRNENHPILIFLHDIKWPWGRRDLYYSPEQIPEDFRQPYTWEGGVTLDSREVIDGGFRGLGNYAIAKNEGGARNGVLTAVDDFTKRYPGEFCFAEIPAVFGLGVLFDLTHPQANLLATIVTPYHHNPLLQAMETNRLANYLAVIKWQDRFQAENKSRAEPIKQNAEPPHAYFEKKAIDLLNLLNNSSTNFAELIEKASAELRHEKLRIKEFIEYLNMLLAIPQDSTALKLISVLQAICLMHSGDLASARTKLEKLSNEHAHCPLVTGLVSHTRQFAEGMR